MSHSLASTSIYSSWVHVDHCEMIELPKGCPQTSVLLTTLSPIPEQHVYSSHDVKKMCIIEGSEKGALVYFKQCDGNYPPLLVQLECAGSASLRIVRGDKAAKVRPVVNHFGKIVGSISYEIPGFSPFSKQNYSAEELSQRNIEEELVARYVREEDDLHPDNLGENDRKEVVGIDFDMLFYPLASKVKGARVINNGLTAPVPASQFPITQADLTLFPNIHDACPCYWPTRKPLNLAWFREFPNADQFAQLDKVEQSKHKIQLAFLKEILFEQEKHLELLGRNFGGDKDSQDMLRELCAHIIARYNTLEDELVNNDGFRKFIRKSPDAFQACLAHFETYNRENHQEGVLFTEEALQRKYYQIIKRCLIKELTNGLYEIGFDICHKAGGEGQLTPQYHRLIDIVIQFEKDDASDLNAVHFLWLGMQNFLHSRTSSTQGQWKSHSQKLLRVIENYSHLFSHKDTSIAESVYFTNSKSRRYSVEERQIVLEEALAFAVKRWTLMPYQNVRLLAIVKEALDHYKPMELSIGWGNLNPMAYFRVREDDFSELLKKIETVELDEKGQSEQLALHILDFTKKGAWHPASYTTRGSANVLLIDRICQAVIEDFKTRLSLEQLKDHELVEVSFHMELGHFKVQESAEKIAACLRAML